MTRMRALLVGGALATAGLIAADLARHPAILADRAAPVYVALLVVIGGGYVAATLLSTRAAAPLGGILGALSSGLWLVELWAGNLAPAGPATLIVYRASTLGVLTAALAGGLLGGQRRGRLADGVSVGALGGMLSGMVVCAVAVSGGALSMGVGILDPPTDAGFADALAAGVNHLWIGLALGSLCGLAGGAAGAALRATRPSAPGNLR